MASVLEPNKTKIAKRVFEIFEFFCDNGQKATVMDIVRRYGRPQSSTSELLSSLVEMGLLYKDPRSRSYTPTPRIAALGTSAQPEIIRDGGLFTLMDRLAQQTGRSVALFGMVGTHVQVFRLASGIDSMTRKIAYGASEQISSSAAGLLLLSTFAPDQAARMLWRLNAESEADDKFDLVSLKDRVAAFRRQGHAVGDAGFGPGVQVAATLLPRSSIRRPLALGVIFRDREDADTMALIAAMNQGIAKCTAAQATGNYYAPTAKPYKIAV
jgi:DNA-binding IclR family transcriptional regulator